MINVFYTAKISSNYFRKKAYLCRKVSFLYLEDETSSFIEKDYPLCCKTMTFKEIIFCAFSAVKTIAYRVIFDVIGIEI